MNRYRVENFGVLLFAGMISPDGQVTPKGAEFADALLKNPKIGEGYERVLETGVSENTAKLVILDTLVSKFLEAATTSPDTLTDTAK